MSAIRCLFENKCERKTEFVACSKTSMSAPEKDQEMTESLEETEKENNLLQPSAIPTQQFALASTPCSQTVDSESPSSFSLSSSTSEASGSSSKRLRKSTTPIRSLSLDDSSFCGVRFRFHLAAPTVCTPDTSLNSPELAIEKEYVRVPTVCTKHKKRVDSTDHYVPLKQRRRKRALDFSKLGSSSRDRQSPEQHLDETSSCTSDDESSLPPPKMQDTKIPNRNRVRGQKICASCQSTKSPMWRDTEDGISLCNACGIRYKRYHSICSRCSYVPRKEERAWKWCKLCGRGK